MEHDVKNRVEIYFVDIYNKRLYLVHETIYIPIRQALKTYFLHISSCFTYLKSSHIILS